LVLKGEDDDLFNLLEHFDEVFEFIDEAHKKEGVVLVHCMAGVSRSATIVVSFLMKKYQLSFDAALRKTKNARPVVSPNPGFVGQLKIWEKCLAHSSCAAEIPKVGEAFTRKWTVIHHEPNREPKFLHGNYIYDKILDWSWYIFVVFNKLRPR